MTDELLSIIKTEETFYFSTVEKVLRQWILVTVANRIDREIKATITITAGKEAVSTPLLITPGTTAYRCHAKTLWPDHTPESAALLVLASEHQNIRSAVSVGTHRPWKMYVLSDVCTDYLWVYDDESKMRKDDSELLEAEIDLARATRHLPSHNRNRYNFVHAREVEFFLERFPHRAAELFERIRNDDLTFNPLLNMCLTQAMGIEDSIRQLYPARNLALRERLDIGYANHQETPTMAWGFASLLAGCGINHLVTGILPYECPWAKRLEEEPVFCWEGPDGRKILVRRYNKHYIEASFLLNGLAPTNKHVHETLVPDYAGLKERYLFDAISLVGCYGDLAENSKTLPEIKTASIIAYNNQGWEYPRLINASHKLFWDDIDSQIKFRSINLPVYSGDYGVSWDAWPAALAKYVAGWRRAQLKAVSADLCAAIGSVFNSKWYQSGRKELHDGWMNTLYMADHAWNGWPESNRNYNAELRKKWQSEANSKLDSVIDESLAVIAQQIPSKSGNRFMVFNTLGWSRTSPAAMIAHDPNPDIIDLTTGQSIQYQIVKDTKQSHIHFVPENVPSAGYKVIEVKSCKKKQKWPACCSINGPVIENSFYRIKISEKTGGIISIYDKTRKCELVDKQSPYHLNQCLYVSETDTNASTDFPMESLKHYSKPVEYKAALAKITAGANGPVFGELIVTSSLQAINIKTIITLYAGIDRIDIRNEVEKKPTPEKQELNFAFPFNVPGRRYRVETPGCMLDPERDMRPGAGMNATAVRHIVDVYNDSYGVLFSPVDTFLIEFGHRTTMEDVLRIDPSNSTILSLAMHNCIDWNETNRTQNNETCFVFRYSIAGHAGGHDPVRAVRFGQECNNELLTCQMGKNPKGSLPEHAHSFVTIDDDRAILVCFKKAEEDGYVARLWNCSEQPLDASLTISGLGKVKTAQATDLLEMNKGTLDPHDNTATIPLAKNEVATMRLITGK